MLLNRANQPATPCSPGAMGARARPVARAPPENWPRLIFAADSLVLMTEMLLEMAPVTWASGVTARRWLTDAMNPSAASLAVTNL